MSDGIPLNGRLGNLAAGATELESNMLKNRVKEILEARMREGFDGPPVIVQALSVTHKGPLDQIDVNYVRNLMEQQYYAIRARLNALGIDHTTGVYKIDEGRTGRGSEGQPGCQFTVAWIPKATIKPALELVRPE